MDTFNERLRQTAAAYGFELKDSVQRHAALEQTLRDYPEFVPKDYDVGDRLHGHRIAGTLGDWQPQRLSEAANEEALRAYYQTPNFTRRGAA